MSVYVMRHTCYWSVVVKIYRRIEMRQVRSVHLPVESALLAIQASMLERWLVGSGPES